MIPITRKELYLNKIVGNDDYSVPEKPISEEEFFFAEILGEAVQAPEPLTRYQLYLAKIAGKSIEIPYPKTRLEYFLARAAGMDVETPVPITKEEIYWSNYTAIVEFELENVPPLTYKAIEGTLKNYRIYGQTVDGESVGDKTKNLMPNTATSQTINGVTFTVNSDGSVTFTRVSASSKTSNFYLIGSSLTEEITNLVPNTNYICSGGINSEAFIRIVGFGIANGVNVDASATFTPMTNSGKIILRVMSSVSEGGVFYPMIRKADIEDDAYEPYGYRVPVTVSNGTDTLTTPIYLPEQIKKVGDEAEYIDFEEQKQHFADGTSVDVELPTLPTIAGANVLAVGTEVQPSKVYVKGEKRRE